MTRLTAFHNSPNIKESLIRQLEGHYVADEYRKGVYWEDGKGCAVGCTVHRGNHKDYETLYGIPRVLAHLEDSIFEDLPNREAKEFPLQFIKAIPVGADLSPIWPKFAVWLLVDPKYGVLKYNSSTAIKRVANLYQEVIDGKSVSKQQWEDAARAAAARAAASRDAARADAARTATYAADSAVGRGDGYVAARAARTAARAYDAASSAAAYAADSAVGRGNGYIAAYVAYDSAAYARKKHRIAQRDYLLNLLSKA